MIGPCIPLESRSLCSVQARYLDRQPVHVFSRGMCHMFCVMPGPDQVLPQIAAFDDRHAVRVIGEGICMMHNYVQCRCPH